MNENFLKTINLTGTHGVVRTHPNRYYDNKSKKDVDRREVVSEHLIGGLKLIDYFWSTFKELQVLNKLHLYELFMYHDDSESAPKCYDVCIADQEEKKAMAAKEIKNLPLLANYYPAILGRKLLALDKEFRHITTPEAEFAHAIDKLEPLIVCAKYPDVRGPATRFTEKSVRERLEPTLKKNQIIYDHFNYLISVFNKHKYFDDETTELPVEMKNIINIR